MFKRALFPSVFMLAAAVAVSATVVGAGALTDRVEARRMTVLKTDLGTGRFLCVEHLHWTAVNKADLRGLQPGDIVRVDHRRAAPRTSSCCAPRPRSSRVPRSSARHAPRARRGQ